MRLIAAALLVSLSGGSALAANDVIVPRFAEETTSSGIDSVYSGEWQYMVGGGAAVFDCSGDGFPDVLLAGGAKPASFHVNRSAGGGPLSFEKVRSGLEFDAVTGAYPLDIDGDGIMDVVMLRVGENLVMKGEGNCRFVRANESWNFDGGDAWSTAFAATWEKGAAWPTLAIGNYIDRAEELEPWGSCTPNWLHRPKAGGGGFAPPVALNPSFCPLSMLFTDWSNSGRPDLRVSNDREYYEGGQEQLWRMRPGQPPVLYSEDDGWSRLKIWGMGIAAHDLDSDGFPEFFLTSMADNKLQTLASPPQDQAAARPTYKDIAWSRGVTAHRPFAGDDLRPSTAWHTEFQDVNNDGRADLFIAKGNVAEMPDFAMKDPNNLMVQGPDGTFREMADRAGVASTETARGGALADFNLDGRVDLLVVNRNSVAQIWRNATPAPGNWIALRLAGPRPNTDGVGAIVEVRTDGGVQRREIASGGGHVSGQLGWIHFGIADAGKAEIRVRWPDGEWSPRHDVAANAFVILRMGGKAPEIWQPPR